MLVLVATARRAFGFPLEIIMLLKIVYIISIS